jgi:hypothetical protein
LLPCPADRNGRHSTSIFCVCICLYCPRYRPLRSSGHGSSSSSHARRPPPALKITGITAAGVCFVCSAAPRPPPPPHHVIVGEMSIAISPWIASSKARALGTPVVMQHDTRTRAFFMAGVCLCRPQPSPTLAIAEVAAEMRRAGTPLHAFGIGEVWCGGSCGRAGTSGAVLGMRHAHPAAGPRARAPVCR